MTNRVPTDLFFYLPIFLSTYMASIWEKALHINILGRHFPIHIYGLYYTAGTRRVFLKIKLQRCLQKLGVMLVQRHCCTDLRKMESRSQVACILVPPHWEMSPVSCRAFADTERDIGSPQRSHIRLN